jgi:hypothetical protein
MPALPAVRTPGTRRVATGSITRSHDGAVAIRAGTSRSSRSNGAAEADTPLAAEADTPLAAEADTPLAAEADTPLAAEADQNSVPFSGSRIWKSVSVISLNRP